MSKLSFCFFLSLLFRFSAFPKTTIAESSNTTILIQEMCTELPQPQLRLLRNLSPTAAASQTSAASASSPSSCSAATSPPAGQEVDPYTRACLEDCFGLYSDAVSTLNDIVRDYRARRYDDANVEASSVIDVSVTCEDGFLEKQGFVSPLTKRNNDTFQLSAMLLSVISMLKLQ